MNISWLQKIDRQAGLSLCGARRKEAGRST
jgi:hypothetical protein